MGVMEGMAKQHREAASYHDRMAAAARQDNDLSDALFHEQKAEVPSGAVGNSNLSQASNQSGPPHQFNQKENDDDTNN